MINCICRLILRKRYSTNLLYKSLSHYRQDPRIQNNEV
ncbi:unnamed protein product [Amoebophrya sp. A25]|nr:unnamed protein product [Amoebophrya sp. A25]|eukprot:GSA25T00010242001.1